MLERPLYVRFAADRHDAGYNQETMNMTVTHDTTRSFLLLAAVAIGVGVGSDALGATVSALSSDGPSARSTVSHWQMAKNDKKADEQKKAKEEKDKEKKNDEDDDDDDDRGTSRKGNGKNGKGQEQREEAWEKGKGEGNARGKGHGKGKPDKE
jgi:hypothetical protein